jgi:hypothetical protein
MAFARSLKSIAFFIAVLVGSYVAQFDPRYPFILWLLVFVIGLIASFWLREPKVITPKYTFNKYLKQNFQGFKELFKPALRPFIVLIFVLLGLDYMYSWGFIKPAVLISYNMEAQMMGFVFAAGALLSGIAIHYLPRVRKFTGDYFGILLLTFAMIASYLLYALGIPFIGYSIAIILAIIVAYAQSWVTIVVNLNVTPAYRATTLSTVAMILKIPFVLLSPIAGGIIEAGNLYSLLVIIGISMLLLVLLSLFYFRNFVFKILQTN